MRATTPNLSRRPLFAVGGVVFVALCIGQQEAHSQDTSDTGGVTVTPPTIDGYVRNPVTGVVEEAYTVGTITYTLDSLDGDFAGILYEYEDADYLYFAFEQSVAIADNTYGANAIGWSGKRGHKLRDLTQSDHAKVTLYDANGTVAMDFFIDYASVDKKSGLTECLGISGGDGALLAGDPTHFIDASSSLDWNLNVASPAWPSYASDNPERVPTNTYDPGTTADPAYPWIYPLAYEWQIDKAAFGSVGYGALEISEVHNSPLKQGGNPIPVATVSGVKEASPSSGTEVDFAEVITYTLTFTAESGLTNAVLTDVMDENLGDITPLDGGVCSDGDGDGLCEANDTISWSLGNLAIGDVISVQFTAAADWQGNVETIYNNGTFTADELPEPFITNTTEHPCFDSDGDGICGADNCPDVYNPAQTDSDGNGVGDACEQIELALVKTATGYFDLDVDGQLSPGDTVQYELAWSSSGGGTATNVVLSDDPDETYVLSIAAISGGGSYDGNTITWSIGTVTSGDSGTLTYEATMAGDGSFPHGSTAVVNTATIDSDDTSPVSDTESVSVQAAAELAVAKSAVSYTDTDLDGALSPGDTVHYEVYYENIGNAGATTTVLTDDPDETYVASVANISDAGSYDLDFVTWDLGTLAPGDSGIVTYDVTLAGSGSFLDGSTLVPNTVELSSAELAPVTDSASVTVVAAASIALTKTTTGYTDSDGSGALSPGDTVHYSLFYENTGNAAATGSVLSDDPDEAYVASISAISGGGVYDGNTLSWSLGSIAAGASGTLTYSATLGAAGTFDAGSTTVVNTASLSSNEDGPVTDTESVVVSADVSLAVLKSVVGYTDADANGVLSPGDTVQYQVDYSNSGDADATSVTVADDPDEAFVAAVSNISGGGVYDGNVISWSIGTLSAGGSGSLTYDVTLAAVGTFAHGTTPVTNTVQLNSAESGPLTSSASVNVEAAAELSLTKTSTGFTDNDSNGILSPGDTVLYSLSYANNGNASATGASLSDDPDEAYVASVTAISGGGTYDGNTLSWSLGTIAAGGSGTLTYSAVLLDPGAFSDGTTAVLNTASLSSTELADVVDTETVTVTAAALLSIVKSSSGYTDVDADGQLSPGDVVHYQVLYANDGDADATSVVVSDDPDETYVVSIDAISDAGLYDLDLISWDLGTLTPGETGVLTYSATLGGAGTFLDGNTSVVNTVQIASTEDGPITDSATVDVTALVQLNISKSSTGYTDTDGNGVLSPGDTVQYAITYSNSGNAYASSVTLSDDPDEAYVSSIGSISTAGTYDGNLISWNIGSLAAGASGTVTYEAILQAAGAFAHGSTSVPNTATLSAAEDGPISSSAAVTVVAAAELAISKSVVGTTDNDLDGLVSPGDTVSYSVTLQNVGNADASAATASDDPDEAYIGAVSNISGGGVYGGDTIDWSVGALATGASVTFTYDVTLGAAGTFADGTTTVNNTATGTSAEDGPVSASASVNVVAAGDLVVAKAFSGYTDNDANGSLSPGDSVSYAVTYQNLGNAALSAVSVADDPDEAYVAAVDVVSDGGVYDGDLITWSLGAIAPGSSATLTYTLTLQGAGAFTDGTTSVLNTVVASSPEDGPESASETIDVLAAASLALTKVSSGYTDVDLDGVLSPGDLVQYALTYQNNGDADATGATVTDDVDETYVSSVGAISDAGTYDGDVISWSVGTLAAGATATVTYEVTLGGAGTFADGTTDVLNTATLLSNEDGPIVDTATVTVTAAASLAVDKVVDGYTDVDGDGVLSPGDSVQYSVSYQNDGNATATSVTLVDDPNETYVASISGITGGGVYDGNTIQWSLGSLTAGASGTVSYDAVLQSAGTFAPGDTIVTNTVDLDSTETAPVSDAETVTVSANPILAITKAVASSTPQTSTITNTASVSSTETASESSNAAADTVTTSTEIAYTITVSNSGTATASAVEVVDALPAGTSLVSATGAYVESAGTVTWTLGSMTAGSSSTLSLVVATD